MARELDNLSDKLGLREVGFSVLGHSWGGIFGGEWAASRPQGLRRLILMSAPASQDLWTQCANALKVQLPQDVQDALDRGEQSGDYESHEYQAAYQVYYHKHLCRLDP